MRQLSIIACPPLPCEKSTSGNRYRACVRDTFRQTFPNIAFNEVLSSEDANLSKIAKQWHRFVVYPLALRRRVRKEKAASPVIYVEDHSSGQLCGIADPTVVFCHDLAPLELNVLSPLQFHSWRMRVLRIKRARWIVTNSEYTRQMVIGKLGFPPERITVNYLGLPDHFKSSSLGFEKNPYVRRILALGESVLKVLHAGHCQPRKNISALLRAIADIRDRGIPVTLIKVGGSIRNCADSSLLDKLNLRSQVLDLGYVPDLELPAIYRSCDVLAFPSLVEGFGWPTIEAQACGIPVVLSDIPCFREVGGDSVLYHPPNDHLSLSANLIESRNNVRLRAEMIERGRKNAGRFDWTKHCELLVEIFSRVGEEHAREIISR